MPADRVPDDYGFDAASRLSFDEIERLVRGFVRVGMRKLRITGGEPLLRKRLPELIARLAAIDGIEDLALTTNGSLLAAQARALREAGLHRLTVSLDARDPALFAALSGDRGDVNAVLRGLDAAVAAGFERIKLNCVVQRGINDDQVLPLVEFAREHGHVPRFIEYMDVGTCNDWNLARVVLSAELRDRIHARWPLQPLDAQYRGEVATRYRFLDGGGEVGFVSSISEPFCGDCHRARVSADGRLYTCLFAGEGSDLRPWLAEDGDALLDRLGALWRDRGDRYSESRSGLRVESSDGSRDSQRDDMREGAGDAARTRDARKRVEMFLVGG